MKLRLLSLFIVPALFMVGASSQANADNAVYEQVPQAIAAAEEAPQFPPAGIKMGEGVVHPGDPLPIVFGVVGPPDELVPLRSKSKKDSDDYVHMTYRDRFSININKNNKVQSMMIETNNIGLLSCPFKIGDSKETILKSWKEPERTVDNMLIYYHRGVYFLLDKETNKKIENIYFTAPGQTKTDGNSGKKAG